MEGNEGGGREGKEGRRECVTVLCCALSASTNACLQEGVHGQLRHLPYPSELYKSYFPSWKMLEDALCPHPVLREHITEVKEDLKSVLSDRNRCPSASANSGLQKCPSVSARYRVAEMPISFCKIQVAEISISFCKIEGCRNVHQFLQDSGLQKCPSVFLQDSGLQKCPSVSARFRVAEMPISFCKIQGCRNAHQFLQDSGLQKWAEKLPGESR